MESPVKTSRAYNIDKIKTLIELNGDVINFSLSFKVKSSDGSPFSMAVVDQQTLDAGNPIQYQEISNGEISGDMSWTRNIYSPYFMVLKAGKKIEVTVDLLMTPLAITEPVKEESEPQQQQQPQENSKYMYMAVFGGVIVLVALYYLSNKGGGGGESTSTRISLGGGGRPSLLTKLKQLQKH